MNIFKSYDIRGIYPSQLNEDTAYKIGRAYATLIQRENFGKKLKICVGRDMRLSSPELARSLILGLLDQGVNVIDLGLVSTPTLYFSVGNYNFNGGIMVSASHNPKEYNGFKLVRHNAIPISGNSGIKEIETLVHENKFDSTEKGTLELKEGVVKDQVKHDLTYSKENIKPLKIVVDPANSMGIPFIKELFQHLPCELIEMNFELDGTFPSHPADPFVEENNEQIRKKIIFEGADLGIALDGDGDRVFFFNEKGEMVSPSVIRGLTAQSFLKDHPGAKIGYDIRPGKITEDLILESGGIPILTKVGHSFIKESMRKEGCVFSGESSGHFMLNTSHGAYEVPMIVILRILEFISEKNMPVSEIMKLYDRYFNSGEINSKVEDPDEKIRLITEEYNQGKTLFLDGVDIFYPDFWFVVRKSNTEPLLRLVLEANTKEIMEEKRDELLRLIRE